MAMKEESKLQEPDLVILIDMDQTLADFVGSWKKIWNTKHPDRLITEDPTEFLLEDAYFGFAKEEEVREIYHSPEFYINLEPLPGALEAIKQMEAVGLDLFICSSPASANSSYTEKADWVEMHLGREWVKKLILTRDKTMVHGDYLIDDKPSITGIYAPSWEHVLFDTTYNRDEDNKQFRITWQTWPSLLLHDAGYSR